MNEKLVIVKLIFTPIIFTEGCRDTPNPWHTFELISKSPPLN